MARPQRNNVDYFPFYCEEGKKMFYIEETYGNNGFATFVKLLRELAKADYHYLDLSDKTTQMFLAAKCKVPKETLLSIITDLVDLGKFNELLWTENNIIWCQDFIDSIQDAYNRRSNECMTFEGLLEHLICLGVRKRQKSKSQSDVKPQTKEKETKVKEDREKKKNDTLAKSKSKFLEDLKLHKDNYSKDMLNAFYNYWTELNQSKTKMRFQLEKTFEINKRLVTWARREK